MNTEAETEEVLPQPRTPAANRSRKRLEGSPQEPAEGAWAPASDFSPPELQENNACGFSHPDLWQFDTATLGNGYRETHAYVWVVA